MTTNFRSLFAYNRLMFTKAPSAQVMTVGLSRPVNFVSCDTSRATLMILERAFWASSPCVEVSALYCSMYNLQDAFYAQQSHTP